MAKGRIIVVDGANVAYEELSKEDKPKVGNIVAVRRALEKLGFEPIIIVDAALKYKVDDPEQLENLIEDQVVRQAPAGTEADYFVLATASRQHAQVVSNDRFGPYHDDYPWIEDRRVPLMMVDGRVQLYEDKLDLPRD